MAKEKAMNHGNQKVRGQVLWVYGQFMPSSFRKLAVDF